MAGSYFPHDSNARNDSKILRLRMKYGAEGYGIYFMLLERLREEPDYTSVKDYNIIAFDFRVSADKVKSIIEDFGLFAFTENGERFYSEKFILRMGLKDDISKKRAEAGKKGMASRWGENQALNNKAITNPYQTDNKSITLNKSKVKKNIKETSYGGKEKPAPSAEPEFPEGSFPGTGQEECEAYPVEAENFPKKENSGGAAQNPGFGGVSPGGTVKPPGGARKPRSVAENAEICRESPSWLAAVSMLHGMTVEEVKAELDQFQTHLISNGCDEPKPLNDFKAHFNNLLRIRKREENANTRANHAGARPGAGAKAAGGVGSGAERPRPEPLFPLQPSGQGRGGA